jgi:hypothetical protein
MNILFLLGIMLLTAFDLQAQSFDIAPFARRCCISDEHKLQVAFDYGYAHHASQGFEKSGDRFVYGLQWAEERDVASLHIRFASAFVAEKLSIQYWFMNWPYVPPKMPTIEDPVDDPWQGHWLTARSKISCEGQDCRLTFLPLDKGENPNADNLPGLPYRRTLKIRLLSNDQPPAVERLEVFSGSQQKTVQVRIELGAGMTASAFWNGKLLAYNGTIAGVHGWQTTSADRIMGNEFHIQTGAKSKGLLVEIHGTEPAPSGSHDVTVVTLHAGDRTFSFSLPDVDKGPLYLPDFQAYVTLASDAKSFSPDVVKRGARIREKLALEPEQTYERASREIPALDPVERQGGRLYLPLAVDSSWQKFAFEWGGNITIDKKASKAKGAELERLEWNGNRLSWRLGTGATPTFRPASQDSKLSVLEDYLPIATATWESDGIAYAEEAFATQLSGPLGIEGRDEQTPSALMVKVTARNSSPTPRLSHVWLGVDPMETLVYSEHDLLANNGELVRAHIIPSPSATAELTVIWDAEKHLGAVHIQSNLTPHGEDITYLTLPYVSRLKDSERRQLRALSYEAEKSKVISYWKNLLDSIVRFNIPEKKFETFARAVVGHIHISTTKDPKSGLFMVPAASYVYPVFANEACFQVLMLDALGDHKSAADYLETFIRLQGSRPFEGTYTGDQHEVYHGARVDADRDYTAYEYNLDHGTVLWTLVEHYFMTRDRRWFELALPGMLLAADWVTNQRHHTMIMDGAEKIPEYGLLPAGHLEDNHDWGHWFSVNAFAAAGMVRLAEALQEIGHAAAERISREAEAYRTDLREAVLAASQRSPVIRLRDHTYVPYVPTRPYQRIRLFGPIRVAYYDRYSNKVLPTYRLSAIREVLYGPMILLYTNVFRSDEPLAQWVLDDWEDNATMSTSLGLNPHGWVDDEYWFSRGGMVFQANLQNPTLVYLRRHEIPAAIRNLYNDFVSCYYPDVNVFTEEFRQWRSPSGPFYKIPDEARFVNRVRDLLVQDDGGDLWLASGTPRRWLAPGQRIRFEQMPTNFGPVTVELQAEAQEIKGRVLLPSRSPFRNAWLTLRVPDQSRLQHVEVNGKSWSDFDSTTGAIRLPKSAEPLEVKATLGP